jgi:hypothetical protein
MGARLVIGMVAGASFGIVLFGFGVVGVIFGAAIGILGGTLIPDRKASSN